jgi:cytoskeletal protein CcmA (bactofilin family)
MNLNLNLNPAFSPLVSFRRQPVEPVWDLEPEIFLAPTVLPVLTQCVCFLSGNMGETHDAMAPSTAFSEATLVPSWVRAPVQMHTLVVSAGAVVAGHFQVPCVHVHGTVVGSVCGFESVLITGTVRADNSAVAVQAPGHLRLTHTAQVVGDVRSTHHSMDAGACVSGAFLSF